MTTTYVRNRVSVNDYPEHLNPFFEDDNHNRIRFWTKTKKLVRSNSFSFSGFNEGFKGLRNSIRKGVSRSRRGSTTTSKENSPVVLRRTIEDTPRINSGSERLLNEHGFLIPSHERNSFRYKSSLTPTPTPKHQSDEYFTLPVRTHRFRPEATSTPRKATSVCDHRASQQPFALPGLTHSRKLSTSSLSPMESDRTVLTHRRVSSTSIAGGETLGRKKRKAPLPPNIKVINDVSNDEDSGFQSLNSTQDTATTLLITEDDLQKSTIENSPESNSELQQESLEIIELNKSESSTEIKTVGDSTEIKIIVVEPNKSEDSTEIKTVENSEIQLKEDNSEAVETVRPEEIEPEEAVEPEEINNNIVEQIYDVPRNHPEPVDSIETSEEDEIEEQITKYIDENNDEYSIEHLRQEVNNLCADIELRTREAKSVKDIVRDINRRTAEENNIKLKEVEEEDRRTSAERNICVTQFVPERRSSAEMNICVMDTRLVPERRSSAERNMCVMDTRLVPERRSSAEMNICEMDLRMIPEPIEDKKLCRKDSRLILEQNGHLAKEEEYEEDVKPEPTPVPRVKKETNGSTDLSKPNPIPKPKRSKLFTKIAKVFK